MASGLACVPVPDVPSSVGVAARAASVCRPDDRSVNRSSPPDGECLPRRERLQRRADFLRCYRQGRRRHSTIAVLHFVANDQDHPRLGITASRKVGNSVIRHRVKRRSREIFRRWEGRKRLPAVDLVVHLKPAAATATFAAFESDLLRMLRSLTPSRAA